MTPEPGNSQQPGTFYEFINRLFDKLPKPLQSFFTVTLLLLLIMAGIAWLISQTAPARVKTLQKVCNKYTITGTLTETGTPILNLQKASVSIPNLNAFSTDGFPTDGSFAIHGTSISPEDVYVDLWVSESGKKKYHRRISLSNSKTDQNNCVINLGVIGLGEENKIYKQPRATKSFHINIKDKNLISRISNQSHRLYKANSDLYIEIKETGEIQQLDNQLYYYPGGKLQVLVSSTNCCREIDVSIERTLPSGNPKQFVIDAINTQVADKVKGNITTVLKAILECIN